MLSTSFTQLIQQERGNSQALTVHNDFVNFFGSVRFHLSWKRRNFCHANIFAYHCYQMKKFDFNDLANSSPRTYHFWNYSASIESWMVSNFNGPYWRPVEIYLGNGYPLFVETTSANGLTCFVYVWVLTIEGGGALGRDICQSRSTIVFVSRGPLLYISIWKNSLIKIGMPTSDRNCILSHKMPQVLKI